jgi:signal peptidase I
MKKRTKIIYLVCVLIIIFGVISIKICRENFVDYCVQNGSSMSPAIKNNETCYLNKLAYLNKKPERWDIIAFYPQIKNHKKMFMLRIIGLPGDKIESVDNELFINGKKLEYPEELNYLKLSPGFARKEDIEYSMPMIKYPYKVPQNSYYVRGDNNLLAYDSRSWGSIPENNIIGKVIKK